MGVIRWMAHVDYVARWSLWLHHPYAMFGAAGALLLLVVVLSAVAWRGTRRRRR